MSMTVDGSTAGAVNYKELFAQVLKGKDLDGTESGSSVVLNGDSVTISVRDPESGETVARTIPAEKAVLAAIVLGSAQSMYSCAATSDEILDLLAAFAQECGLTPPEGGSPAPNVPKMTLAELGEALQKMGATTPEKAASGALLSGASENESTFFDIYALMALLQEVGQKEREAARDLKYAELNTEVASIHAQANKQREAGILGAIVSGVTMCVQLAMTAVSVAQSVGSIKSSYNTSAAQDANLAETKFASLQEQNKGVNAANANLEHVQKMAGPEAKQTVETAMKDAGVPKARDDYQTAKANEASVTEKQTAIKDAESANVKEFDKKIAELTKKNGNGAFDQKIDDEIKSLEGKKLVSQQKITDADSKIKDAGKRTETAQDNYLKALDNAQSKLDAQYASASTKTKLAEQENIQTPSKQNGKDVIICRQEQKQSANASKLMAATVASEKANMDVKSSPQEISTAKENAALAGQRLAGDPAFKSAQNLPMMMLYQSLPHMIGNMGQSCAQMATSLVSAEGTMLQADQKTAEMHREETNALFAQAQELITSARECCKAIFQAESQSVEQIIRA